MLAGRKIGGWALADQGVVSLGAFLSNIVLARTMAPEEYGLYGALLGLLLFLNSAHSSVVAYPLSVQGATVEPAELKRLAGVSLVFTAALAGALGAPLVAAFAGVGRLRLGWLLAGAMLFWQLQETLRRGFMAHFHHRRALWGDSVSYLGQAGVLAILLRTGPLEAGEVLLVMLLTSAAALLLQAAQLSVKFAGLAASFRCGRDFWRLGKWVLLASLAAAFCTQCPAWALAVFRGTESAACFQAAINLLGVAHPVMFGLSNLIVPGAAYVRRQAGVRRAWSWTRAQAVRGGLLLLPYFLLLLLFPGKVLAVFYGPGSPYLGLEEPVRICVLAYAATYLAHIAGAFLAGLERPGSALRMHLVSAAASLTVGLPLTLFFSVKGACAGLLIASLVRAGAGAVQVGKQCGPRPLEATG